MKIQEKISYILIAFLSYQQYFKPYVQNQPNLNYKILFTPGDNCTQEIVNEISSAKKEILIQAFAFTCDKIKEALIKSAKKKVKITILIDKRFAYKNIIQELIENGINAYVDLVSGIAHNKIIIIDKKKIITGSFNFTHAAQHKNTENCVFINDEKITKKFIENFEKRLNSKRIKKIHPTIVFDENNQIDQEFC